MTPPTSQIVLRDVAPADLPIFFEQQADQAPHTLAGTERRERESFMAHWQQIMANEAGVHKTILYNGQVAGNVVCFERDGLREVGYRLGSEFWGRGIASRALREFVAQVTVRPLYGRVAKRHPASRRVLEKCGFVMVGEDTFTAPSGEEVEEFLLKLDA